MNSSVRDRLGVGARRCSRVAASNGLLALLLCVHGACFSNGGSPLGEMPPSRFSVALTPTEAGTWNVMIEILPLDLSLCPTISNQVAAEINGKPLGLSDSGGQRQIKGGAETCGYPRYENWGLSWTSPVATASIRLSDDSATYVIESPGGLSVGDADLTSPVDGVVHPGTTGTIAISAEADSIAYAMMGFCPDSNPTTALFTVDSTGGQDAITLNGMSLTFSVPRTVSKAGPGTLCGSVTLMDRVSVCSGPAECKVQSGFSFAIPATLANP